MLTNAVFYDLAADTAFRVMRSHADTAFTRRVDMNTGRSILKEPIELKVMHEIYQRKNEGELIRIPKPKEIARMVSFLKELKVLDDLAKPNK